MPHFTCPLNPTRVGDSTTVLQSLFLGLTTLLVNKCFIISNWNLPWHSWRLIALVLSLVAWEKRLSCSLDAMEHYSHVARPLVGSQNLSRYWYPAQPWEGCHEGNPSHEGKPDSVLWQKKCSITTTQSEKTLFPGHSTEEYIFNFCIYSTLI